MGFGEPANQILRPNERKDDGYLQLKTAKADSSIIKEKGNAPAGTSLFMWKKILKHLFPLPAENRFSTEHLNAQLFFSLIDNQKAFFRRHRSPKGMRTASG